jgi:hypothetical protein
MNKATGIPDTDQILYTILMRWIEKYETKEIAARVPVFMIVTLSMLTEAKKTLFYTKEFYEDDWESKLKEYGASSALIESFRVIFKHQAESVRASEDILYVPVMVRPMFSKKEPRDEGTIWGVPSIYFLTRDYEQTAPVREATGWAITPEQKKHNADLRKLREHLKGLLKEIAEQFPESRERPEPLPCQ